LDEFLKISERDILRHAGKFSHEAAIKKARTEYEKFRKQMLEKPSLVERHFIEAIQEVKKLEKNKALKARKKRSGKNYE